MAFKKLQIVTKFQNIIYLLFLRSNRMTKSDCENNKSVEYIKQLWRAIYEQEHVASRMVEIAAKKEGITFEIEAYGTIQLLVKPASAVGDNYMSDTYYNTIVLNNGGEEQKAFVKVNLQLTAF